MKKQITNFITYLLTFTFGVVFSLSLSFFVARSAQAGELEGQIIIQYASETIDLTDRADRAQIIRLEKANGLSRLDEIKGENIRLLITETNPEQVINELQSDDRVALVEPNRQRELFITPNDTSWGYQWSLHNTGQTIIGYTGIPDADMDGPEGWDYITGLEGSEVVAAVIDTGVRYDHLDLVANMWDGTICRDENGTIISGGCPHHGWDYAANDNDPLDEGDAEGEDKGHGTHVAGIIGASSNNSYGMSGFSYANEIKIMAVRFGFSTYSEVKAINFANHNGARLINASYGGDEYSQLEKNAIDAFPGLFMAAAGNGGDDHIGDNNDSLPMYPCSYNSANIVCVAATTQQDQLATYSNYGNATVDLGAPGSIIYSTYPSDANPTTSFAFMSGTSMATPQVVGMAAMLATIDPTLTNSEIKSYLLSSGDSLSALSGKTVSGKRANLYSALAALDDNDPPILSAGTPEGEISTVNLPVYLALSTNEPATCRYSATDQSYSLMTASFSSTGLLSHTTLLSGLQPSQNYEYFIRCLDRAGNENPASLSIAFSTSSSFVPYTPPTDADESATITTSVRLRSQTLQTGRKHTTKKKDLIFTGQTSGISSGQVRVYQGRRSFAFKKQAAIQGDGSWRAKYRTRKNSYLIKFIYLDNTGSTVTSDGPFYVRVR